MAHNHRPNSNGRPRRPPSSSGIPAYIMGAAGFMGGSFFFTYLYFQDEAPFTKRKRLLITPTEWERRQGDAQYKELLNSYKNHILPPTHRSSKTVNRVGSRITQAANKFIKEYKPNESIGGPYTYTVIRSDQANAFVLPNNHIFVFTGLFQFVKNEDDLAAVLGHETAHNLARHAGERVTGSILMSILARFTLLIDPNGLLYTLFLPAATLLHDLPHSRDHEIEADYIGLQLAADACYDPQAAKRVFGAMKKAGNDSNTGSSPEFISTHPSYDTRLTNFDAWLPGAMEKYNSDGGYKCQRIRREMKAARQQAAILAQNQEGGETRAYQRQDRRGSG